MPEKQGSVGGAPGSVESVDFDAQERRCWAVLAEATEGVIAELHPMHPERISFLEMWVEFRRAAGQPSGLDSLPSV
jgi:hypothetical protein